MGPLLKRATSTATRTLPSVKIVTVEEMREVVSELERVGGDGVTPATRAAVIAWAAGYSEAYFRTRSGALRRMFPKGRAEVLFRQKEKAHAAS